MTTTKPAGTGRPDSPVALVTGASGGLGQALAVQLDALGCRVAVHYNSSAEKARAVADKLQNESIVVGGNVADWDAVVAMYKEISEQLGPVDVLVNNGGIRRDQLLAMQSPEDWRAVIDTNLVGSFHVARVSVGNMIRRRWGRIVNIVSPSGLIASAGQTAYSASKAGLIGFTRSLAAEVGKRGVTVNALSPGFMETPMTANVTEKALANIRDRGLVPLFPTVEEVARSMSLFLDSPTLTGQVISIDAGVSIS